MSRSREHSDGVAALDNNPTRFQPVPRPGIDDKLCFYFREDVMFNRLLILIVDKTNL